ncbi:ABC transporter permease subunit [Acinetobacter sp. B5B]|uniref:ABC transporter permease n=1 Tax=Acinetobacter baretiae TaxID=2605383 RepID=UPI0018C1E87D|nr:ABC transporter permease subunit [Acinetobacter baretiae]MBF7683169.1 ABC transporter permease subunit [Acinetobacter baretiae]MBF7684565.1 ABC transporter permease subunit [Acinetobacter baretiae]
MSFKTICHDWLATIPTLVCYLVFFILPVVFVFYEPLQSPIITLNRMLSDQYLLSSITGSLLLSIFTSMISLLIAVLISFHLSRCSDQLRQFFIVLISLPLVFSGLIVAYGFILVFGRAGFITQLLGQIGFSEQHIGNLIFTPIGLGMAYCYYLIPRAVFILLPVFQSFDWRQIDISKSFGATTLQSYRLILFPQILPAMVTSLCVMCSVALGAYGTALALSGTQLNILPLVLYSKVSDGGTDFPVVGMLSIILITLCLIFTLTADYLARKCDYK